MWMSVERIVFIFCCKQKTAYELRISDWSSDVCSSDLFVAQVEQRGTHVDVLAQQRFDREGIEAPLQFSATIQRDVSFGRLAGFVVVHQCTAAIAGDVQPVDVRSEEHRSELQSLKRRSYDVIGLNKYNIASRRIAANLDASND